MARSSTDGAWAGAAAALPQEGRVAKERGFWRTLVETLGGGASRSADLMSRVQRSIDLTLRISASIATAITPSEMNRPVRR